VDCSVTLAQSAMRALAVILIVAVSACAKARPATTAQEVRFTTGRDAVSGCTPLGLIDSSDKTNGGTVSQVPVERDRYRRLRNEAVRLGANIVLLLDTPRGMTDGNNQLEGEAYKCAFIKV